MFRDFKAIKAQVSIELAMVYLQLKGMTAENGTYRGECPVCRAGSRSLVITPEKQAFFCHASKKGGDVISLTAHLHGTSMKDAAGFLEDKHARKSEKPEKTKANSSEILTGSKDWSKDVKSDHPEVEKHNISAEDALRLGVGYKTRGLYRGKVVAPLRSLDGQLITYAPLAEDFKFPDTLKWPDTNVVILKKRA